MNRGKDTILTDLGCANRKCRSISTKINVTYIFNFPQPDIIHEIHDNFFNEKPFFLFFFLFHKENIL